MSQYTPTTLESLLSSLKLTSSAPHAEILDHANSVLRSETSHVRTLHTKAVALLNLDRYEEAFSILSLPELSPIANLERAYVLYKLGRLEDALSVASGDGGGGTGERGLKHVEAQAAYRLERFGRATEVYTSLTEAGGWKAENEDYDLSVNISATNAQLVWAGGVEVGVGVGDGRVGKDVMDAFETAFNAACAAVARGLFGQALVLLKRAKELGGQLEDLSEEERKIEVAPVLAQEVYVLAKLGRWQEASERCEELDIPSITDASLKVVAVNNEIAISSRLPAYNPHLSLIAAAASTTTTTAASRAFSFQSKILDRNRAVLELQVGKTHAAKKKTQAHLQVYPNDAEASVLLAASREGKIENLVVQNPSDVGLSLTLAQHRMRRGNLTGAISAVEKLVQASPVEDGQKYLPGVVGLLVGLYQLQGRTRHVKEVLAGASEFWKKSPTPNNTLLRSSGKAHLDSTNPTDADLSTAHEIFTSLLTRSPNDPFCTAGIIASSTDVPANLTARLTPLDKLLAGIDAVALEAAGVAQAPTRKRPAEEATAKDKVGKKRKKRTHGFDTGKVPDPERWLALRDRSTYRPKGKKGKKSGGGGATQGGGGGGEESMELAGGGRVDVVKVNTKGKKKKKGGKW